MSNDYFDFSGANDLDAHTSARAEALNALFQAIEDGFDKLPAQAALTQNRSVFVVATGVANAYLAAPSTPWLSYENGASLALQINVSNGGPSTANVSGLGVKAIKRLNGSDVATGDLVAGSIVELRYDGTNLRMTGASAADVAAASVSALAAAASASAASTSASGASSSASAASSSASSASTSATNASSSASAAASSASAAAASFDSFDDRYLGSKSSDPTLDNDGNALLTGALYWNSIASELRFYTGSAWVRMLVVNGLIEGTLGSVTPAAATVTTLTTSGNVQIGPAPSLTTNPVTITGDGGARNVTFARFQTAVNGPTLDFFKSRGTVASPTDVVLGDNLGAIAFAGSNGGARVQAATIIGLVDDTPGTGVIPGGLRIDVANASGTLTQRWLIKNDGTTYIGAASGSAPATVTSTGLNNTVIGASTPAAATVKTLAVTDTGGQLVTITGATSSQIRLVDSTVTTRILSLAAATCGIVGTLTNHDFAFQTNATEKGRLYADGTWDLGGTFGSPTLRVSPTALSAFLPVGLKAYTVATVPSAGTVGAIISVSDGTSNKRLGIADGTNWRWPDGAIVS